jgi:adenylate kinase family enzyme
MANYISLSEAAPLLAGASRILVIGCSGSGKSTLARGVAAGLGLRHISLDRDVFWLPGWKERPRDEALARIRALIAEERWVMDGSSPGTFDLRLPRTHLVIWVRPPRWVSLRGAFARWIRYFGRTRPEMADNCPEKIDFEFLHYIWTFETYQSPRIEQNLETFGPQVPVLILRSHAEMDRLLTMLEPA